MINKDRLLKEIRKKRVSKIKEGSNPNSEWKGIGFCAVRNYTGSNDSFCNLPLTELWEGTGENGISKIRYCSTHTCAKKGCRKAATAFYPNIEGSPGFCWIHRDMGRK